MTSEPQVTPVAALHVCDSGSRLQIRMQADAVIAHGDDVAETWSRVPEQSRSAYSRSCVPGSPIPDVMAHEPIPDAAAFAVVRLDIRLMDLLHLGPQHWRAQFARGDGWAGRWVAP